MMEGYELTSEGQQAIRREVAAAKQKRAGKNRLKKAGAKFGKLPPALNTKTDRRQEASEGLPRIGPILGPHIRPKTLF
jgi:hypothetical protein